MFVNLKLGTIGVAATLATVGVAWAADVPYVPPPAAPPAFVPAAAFDWNGLYFGVHGGGGFGKEDCTSCSPGPPGANDFNISGPYVGGQVGVNWVAGGGLFLGAEADISWSGIDGLCNGSGVGGAASCNGPPQLTVHDIDWYGTVRGRVGFATGDWLAYVTGGWLYGQGTRNTSSGGGDTAVANHSGWTAGFGAERAIGAGWSAKGEYKYLAFGPRTYVFPNIGGPDPTVNLTAHTFELGLNRHF